MGKEPPQPCLDTLTPVITARSRRSEQERGALNKLPEDFSATAIAEIRNRLDDVRSSGARVLFAIESGSRAWGFPSPDSDYDCRFIYARSAKQHLVLKQARDVLEYPIIGDIDAGGWDLRKALLLALDGNAVVSEWARSLIVYEEETSFRPRFVALLDKIVDPALAARHYLGLARTQLYRMGDLEGEINLKKLFYVIRPLIALAWMEQRSFDKLPPMNLQDCLAEANLSPEIEDEIRTMIAEKALAREMGTGRAPESIATYILKRFAEFADGLPTPQFHADIRLQNYALAEEFYTREVELA